MTNIEQQSSTKAATSSSDSTTTSTTSTATTSTTTSTPSSASQSIHTNSIQDDVLISNFNSPLPPDHLPRVDNPHLRIQIPSSSDHLSNISVNQGHAAPPPQQHSSDVFKQPHGLGAPLSFSSPTAAFSDSPSKASFDKITELPTPVLNNGSFDGNFNLSSSPQEVLLPEATSPLKIEKNRSPKYVHTNNNNHHNKLDLISSPQRILSEYKPIPALGRKNSLIDHSGPLMAPKRIISNPIRTSPRPGSSSGTTPTPPPSTPPSYLKTFPTPIQGHEEDVELHHRNETETTVPAIDHKYSDRSFYSPRLNKSFKFVKEVGSGNFSTVILTQDTSDENNLLAIKVISIPTDNENQVPNFKSFLKRELNILYQVSHHPCITQLIDYDVTFKISPQEVESTLNIDSEDIENDGFEFNKLMENNNQLIFLKYCPGGNLLQYFMNHRQSDHINELSYWVIVKRIICELIVTVCHLHSVNIIHRDIKLENILLNFTAEEMIQLINTNENLPSFINLSDFGLSKKLKYPDQLLSTRCGSQDYISPEILMGLKYNGKLTDSWSVGVLIYAILEERLPFDLPSLDVLTASGISPSVIKRRRSKNSSAHRIAMIDWDWFKVNEYLNDDSNINADIKQIITQLKSIVQVLLVRRDKRITVTDICTNNEFHWIKDFLPPALYESIQV
ncbi:kinase-like domain-containing protein [Scheffersomyces coipomensis]|uniref:kinase-like domain-containing protein n=1 Tax=Scheffersomyces coipomensis TaxID=1788519 RepID=UPI00315D2D39